MSEARAGVGTAIVAATYAAILSLLLLVSCVPLAEQPLPLPDPTGTGEVPPPGLACLAVCADDPERAPDLRVTWPGIVNTDSYRLDVSPLVDGLASGAYRSFYFGDRNQRARFGPGVSSLIAPEREFLSLTADEYIAYEIPRGRNQASHAAFVSGVRPWGRYEVRLSARQSGHWREVTRLTCDVPACPGKDSDVLRERR